MESRDPRRIALMSRARGLVLGMALGEALVRSPALVGADDAYPCGVSTQLGAFALEGGIRAIVRGSLKGVCSEANVVWHAVCRWGAGQGIWPEDMRPRGSSSMWPDGWLAGVPTLRAHRGRAPATESAIKSVRDGHMHSPRPPGSHGWQAVTTGIPLAAVAALSPGSAAAVAGDVARMTHGHPSAAAATHLAVDIVSSIAHEYRAGGRLEVLRTITASPDGRVVAERLAHVSRTQGRGSLAEKAAAAAGDGSAPGVLAAAALIADRFCGPDDFRAAVDVAAGMPSKAGVASVVGAIHGARHGVERLPVADLSRLELVWVLDTLARDAVTVSFDAPQGSGYGDPPDPRWWDRYPGW